MPPKTCTGPGCTHTARAKGLCSSHFQQQARGRPLTPLRGPSGQKGAAPMVRLPGIRVSPECRDWLEREGPTVSEAARKALEEKVRGGGER
jgi:hypothetical protein